MDFLDVDDDAVTWYLPGDVLAILLFVLLGELRHGGLTVERYAGVLLPFLIGWLIVAPVVGAYGERTVDSTRSAILLALVGWLGADFLGQVLRGTDYFPGNADPQFFLVTLLFGGLLLAVARFASLVVVDFAGD